jgi:hypothetical protein
VRHVHATPGELAARAARRAQMSRATRAGILLICSVLWLSGALWLLAHFAFPAHNEFGALPNAWEAPLMRVHGLIAVAAVFLFGWVGAGHILARWSAATNRLSGLWLLGFAVVLVLTGYALYYSDGALHAGAAAVHEWFGLVAILAALAHWLRIRAGR